MPTQFSEIASLYDELMDGVPYVGWIAYLRNLFEEHHLEPIKVLDLACGTGNVTELLLAVGYQVTGVDIAPDMIAEARRKAQEKRLLIDYFVQDAAEMELPDKDYDLCVSLFDSMNYITEPERLQLAFKQVYAHLLDEGAFIFDINSEFALKNHFFDQQNFDTEEALRYDWKSEYFPDTRLCKISMKFEYANPQTGEKRNFDEEHLQFAYRDSEIRAMLIEAGFPKIRDYQAYSLKPPGRAADRIFYVAQK